jgi:predicted ATPase
VELSGLTDAQALPGAIAAALSADLGTGDATAALLATVAPLTMLLVLDNAEHLLGDVAALCVALHDAAPGVRLLVTSQAPLKIAVEHIYRLEPLPVPEGSLPVVQALEFGSVALFVWG